MKCACEKIKCEHYHPSKPQHGWGSNWYILFYCNQIHDHNMQWSDRHLKEMLHQDGSDEQYAYDLSVLSRCPNLKKLRVIEKLEKV